MKVFLVFFAFAIAAVSAVPLESEADTDGWFVPDDKGDFHWVSKKQFEDEFSSVQPRAVSVQFYLYTKSSPTSAKQLFLNDAGTLSKSGFNKAYPTRFVFHGWRNNYQSDVNIKVRNALMKSGTYNVICVDWSSVAENLNYVSSRYSISVIGKKVAAFIDFLNSSGGMPFGSLSLIGYSLGAHVCGFTGKQVTRGKVDVIIGLDPTSALFSYSNCAGRLCITDATYVESIQTNGGILGFLEPIGKAAFYPNGGKYQRGCGLDLTGACSHARSYIYYSESLVRNNFPTMKCPNYQAAHAKNCGSSYSYVRMGSPASYGNSGSFYVPVNRNAPYGMG